MTPLRESGYWWLRRSLINICSRQRGTVWNIYFGSVPSVAFRSHSHSTPSCSIRILEGSGLPRGLDQLRFHGSLRFLWQAPAERRVLPAHSVQTSSRREPNEWYFLLSFFLNLSPIHMLSAFHQRERLREIGKPDLSFSEITENTLLVKLYKYLMLVD